MGISDQAQPPPPRGALKILWEGLKLPCNNLALLRPILLLSFLSSSLFFLFTYLCLTPLIHDLTTKSTLIGNTDPKSPEYSLLLTAVLKDLKELGLIEVASLVVLFLVRSLVATATVHVLSTAHSPSKLKEVFAGLDWRSLAKRSMITQLYGAFVILACSLMFVLTVALLSFYITSSSSSAGVEFMVILALGVIVAVLEVYMFLYLSMVVNTSVVVSVVEEGCYGLEAIAKASRLIRGRRRQAIRIVLAELAVAELSYGVYYLVTACAPQVDMARLAVGLGQVALGVVVNVLIWSVQTVYYYECSAGGHGEEIATKGGFEYIPVRTQVDEALL